MCAFRSSVRVLRESIVFLGLQIRTTKYFPGAWHLLSEALLELFVNLSFSQAITSPGPSRKVVVCGAVGEKVQICIVPYITHERVL